MDKFKRAQAREVGHGGMKCSCCGPKPGDERKKLRRRARRRLKQKDRSDGGQNEQAK